MILMAYETGLAGLVLDVAAGAAFNTDRGEIGREDEGIVVFESFGVLRPPIDSVTSAAAFLVQQAEMAYMRKLADRLNTWSRPLPAPVHFHGTGSVLIAAVTLGASSGCARIG